MFLSPSPSPYHLPLGGASPAAGQLAAIKAGILCGRPRLVRGIRISWKGQTRVTKLAGLLFTPKERSSFMGQPIQCQTGTWGWNQWVEGRKLWELFQTRDCEGCNFFLFSVGDCGNTPSLGSMWLRDLPKVHSWPQGSFRSQNISCSSRFSTANSALWQRGKLWSTSNLYQQVKHSFPLPLQSFKNDSNYGVIFLLLGLDKKPSLVSRKPELNTTLMEGTSEGLTKGRPTPVDPAFEKFLEFFASFWKFFRREKKK